MTADEGQAVSDRLLDEMPQLTVMDAPRPPTDSLAAEAADDPRPPSEPEELPPPADPMAVARVLVADRRFHGALTDRWWRGGWMRWDHTRWIEVEETVIRSGVYERLEHAEYLDTSSSKPKLKPWQPNRRKVSDVLDALTSICHLPEHVDPPDWLTGRQPVRAGEVVACANGLLHVGTRALHELTPRFFNRVAVPFDYDPTAPAPARWLEFLNELWPDDPDSIAALQEFFGYVLSGRTDLHKIMLLIGPTRSGKGTIARVLAALLGKGNAAGPTLASLGTNFGLSPLLGKPLAVVSDARLGGANTHQVVERLLSISGEDMLTVDRKYREPWTGKLPTRFLVLSNELPRFGDASGAIAHRFVVLTMHRSFLGKENTRLTGQLLAELPGILTWALDGLDRLTANGTFTEPTSSADAILALQDLVSPVAAFVRDRCKTGIGLSIGVEKVFTAWREWCDDNGHKPGSVQTFGRDLRAVVPHLQVARPRNGETRERRYLGVTLSAAHNGAERGPSRTSPPQPDPDESPGRAVRAGPQSNPLSAEHDTVTCERCRQPADELIAGRCRDCAYPPGSSRPDDEPREEPQP